MASDNAPIPSSSALEIASAVTSDTIASTCIPQVESPSVSTPQARARFEFEANQGSEGTKVLMVEWDDDEVTKNIEGNWTIAWEGKPTPSGQEDSLLPATDSMTSPQSRGRSHEVASSVGNSHRMFFLLGAKRSVPAIVTLTLQPQDSSFKPITWTTNPLPAIFPPGFADGAKVGNGKGVLHNMWASRRLQTLEKEIEQEAKTNCEGIAFQLAISEKDWIEQNFGVSLAEDASSMPLDSPEFKTNGLSLDTIPIANGSDSVSPSSPLSPGGSRLSVKLKGLKLRTTADSSVKPVENEMAAPLCQRKREQIHADATSAISIPSPSTAHTDVSLVTPAPSATIHSSISSIGAILAGQTSDLLPQKEEEEELFALPLSPRSPDMSMSPFSWAAEDTRRYLSAQRVS